MRLTLLAAAVLPSAALATAPGEMSIAEFLPKAEALQAKGMGAMFSSDLKPVMAEMKAVGTSYRADLAQARAAGRTDLGCPPPKGSPPPEGRKRMSPNELLDALRVVPPAHRATTTVKTAFYAMMRRRFPC